MKDVWKGRRFDSDSMWPVKMICLSTSACNTLLCYGLTGDSKAGRRNLFHSQSSPIYAKFMFGFACPTINQIIKPPSANTCLQNPFEIALAVAAYKKKAYNFRCVFFSILREQDGRKLTSDRGLTK